MSQAENWNGKVAIVTGGSSGIGRSTALALAEAGAKVVITGRTKSRLEEVSALHENLSALVADSSAEGSAEEIVAAALNISGRIDALINNAGAGGLRPVGAYDADFIYGQCATNIVGPSLLLNAALGALKESRGAVVNISSAVARKGSAMVAHYGATKLALEYLTRAWAIELAEHGIRVNCIAPGPTKSGALTGMMGLDEQMAAVIEQAEAAQVPLGRRGVPDDIVPWILAFASGSSQWTTGQVLTIDGGWSQRG